MGRELTVNSQTIHLNAPRDGTDAERVARHFQHMIEEDDWRPYKNKAEAIAAWSKLSGNRVKMIDALGLI